MADIKDMSPQEVFDRTYELMKIQAAENLRLRAALEDNLAEARCTYLDATGDAGAALRSIMQNCEKALAPPTSVCSEEGQDG